MILLRNYIGFTWQVPFSLSELRRTWNVQRLNGSAGCLSMYWPMLKWNWPDISQRRNIPSYSDFIRYYDEEDDREFTFLTNATHVSALDIANLYKKRWLVELFFKWLKQHLKIKRFWGTTENAVRIQISVAIITYCLVAIVQHDMQLKRSIYEVLQILSISLTDKTHLRDLFDKTNFNDVKELDCPLFEGLFD